MLCKGHLGNKFQWPMVFRKSVNVNNAKNFIISTKYIVFALRLKVSISFIFLFVFC